MKNIHRIKENIYITNDEEIKEETLEEFCNRELDNFNEKVRNKQFDLGFRTGTIIGLRFPKKERSYSEEEVKKIAEEVRWQAIGNPLEFTKNFDKWFKKFKKK